MKLVWRNYLLAAVGIAAVAVLLWYFSQPQSTAPAVHPQEPESIPPGIVVTESSTPVPAAPPALGNAPGDSLLAGYAAPTQAPRNDLIIISRVISGFLTINKQATDRPLSANEEWSAALRGLRPGTETWLSPKSPVFDSNQRLIDRWGTPLHFHALGAKQWEIRSAGPDHLLWTNDDLLEKTSD